MSFLGLKIDISPFFVHLPTVAVFHF